MRPTTCYIADDGTVFLPVAHPTDIACLCGHDKAFRACQEHEARTKNETQL